MLHFYEANHITKAAIIQVRGILPAGPTKTAEVPINRDLR